MSQQVIRDARSYAAKLKEYYSDLQKKVHMSPSTDREMEALDKILNSCLSLPTPQREAEFVSCILRTGKHHSAKESILAPSARIDSAKGNLQPASV